MAFSQAQRQMWLAVLARSGTPALERGLSALGDIPRHEVVRAPETGMVMLRGRVGGTGDAFNVGEASLTRCAVRLGNALGVGYSLGRDKRKSELIACLDALLQDPDHTGRVLQQLVQPLAAAQQQSREAGSRATASSKVDFFTMVRGEA